MRIIAGEFGSRRLIAPRGSDTRPTLDRTREALFSMLQPRLQDARVLDLFAGSGALGLEALSRGSREAVFCDRQAEAARAIRANIQALKVQERTRLLRMDWARALALLKEEGRPFDLILLDPPYQMEAGPVLDKLAASGLLGPEGMIVLEHAADAAVEAPEGLRLIRHRRYGDSAFSFFVKEADGDENRGVPGQL